MTDPTPNDTPRAGSLLEGLDTAPPTRRSRPTLRLSLPAGLSAWLAAAWAHPASRWMLGASALMLTATGALGAWVALRPVPKPDYDAGRLDTLFNYTLLTDEFNRLPLDERIALIGQLVGRIKGMDGADSALMAAFAASIAGSARDQLVANASLVMVDLTDRAAAGYDPSAPKAQRVAYVEGAVVEMMRAMRTMGGEDADATDEEILTEAREQAQRDAETFRSGEVGADSLGRFTRVLGTTMGQHSSAQQKLRMGRFGRDMARTLRGEDLDTGKPLPKPPAPPKP